MPKGTVVSFFGRFNPPTTGHGKLVDKVLSVARKHSADTIGYASQSQDPKKNPLSYKDKIKFLNIMFPKVDWQYDTSVKNPINVAENLSKKGYTKLVFVAGGDRVANYKQLLNKYNGDLYNFESIEVVNAGERDPDADDVSGMSASKMRAYAKEGNQKGFNSGLPRTMSAGSKKSLWDAVRKGMNL